jgi:L-lactate dehydrogenase complex protein LldE
MNTVPKTTVQLMLTCLCDALYGEVGIATVKVLEHAGCEVLFDDSQTCCGQPPYNAGDWDQARLISERTRALFQKREAPVVVPSGSCTAMLREGYPLLFADQEHLKAFELSEFLVHQLQLKTWPSKKAYPCKVGYHRACHGRGLHLSNEAEVLLSTIPGLDLVPIENPEQCCGFGGAFCITQGKLSSGIGLEKLRTFKQAGVDEVVSGDMGCLMHLEGLAKRNHIQLRFKHFAQILAEVIEP